MTKKSVNLAELLKAANGFLASDGFATFCDFAKSIDVQTVEHKLKNWCEGKFPDYLREYFARNSWLINGGKFTGIQLKIIDDFFQADQLDAMEDMICNVVDTWQDRILAECNRLDATRLKIIQRAFELHRHEDWLLCIPLFLIQTDGICLDRFSGDKLSGSVDIYDSRRPKKILARFSQRSFFPFLSILTNQQNNTLVKSISPTGKVLPFNRNLVLHGRDTNYDCRANSLRAIAALDFANWLCLVADDADAKRDNDEISN